MSDTFNVVVLGGGFGGSLLATILRKQGYSVGLVDRDRHPRFAIGESSTPTADGLLHQLCERYGISELLPLTQFGTWRTQHPEILCGCKRGFSYFYHGCGDEFQSTTDHRNELLVSANESREVADTQWYRPHVDRYFANVAQQNKVTILDETEVKRIDHEKEGQWDLHLNQGKEDFRWRTSFLIDATGATGTLLRSLQLEDITNQLQTRSHAVFGHFDNVEPITTWLMDRNVEGGDHPFSSSDSACHHLFSDGWMWQLRFESGLTSLGYVRRGDRLQTSVSVMEEWSDLLSEKKVLREILSSARIAHFPGKLFRSNRIQRCWSRAAGSDWAALPFTAGFVDPLHSTGIAHTISGVERIASLMQLDKRSQRGIALNSYSDSIIREIQHVDKMIASCYTGLSDFRLFTACSMIYFAAATASEQAQAAEKTQVNGFLLAENVEFVELVSRLLQDVRNLTTSESLSDAEVDRFVQRVEEELHPYNDVGLFHPEIPNMYSHTAANKKKSNSESIY